MASKITLELTSLGETCTVVLLDNFGTNNSWTSDPPGALHKDKGKWSQLYGGMDLTLMDDGDSISILTFQGLNTHSPEGIPPGKGVIYEDGELFKDNQDLDWKIVKIE